MERISCPGERARHSVRNFDNSRWSGVMSLTAGLWRIGESEDVRKSCHSEDGRMHLQCGLQAVSKSAALGGAQNQGVDLSLMSS